ncbi:nucleotidyltransferase domain-containing protein [Candidatus Woesearchaeota archaeon]|nr:nucleotidyltransferase domain-containing protein [Candidatus Woesearchaeota archaeon]
MKNQLKILKFLIENSQSFSILEISKRLKLNYKIAFEDIMKLKDEGLININKLGNSNQCRFSNKFNEKVLKTEIVRKENLLKNKSIYALYKWITEIENPFLICLIFGSYSRGAQSKHSDIDVCLISDDEKTIKEFEQIASIMHSSVHLSDFSTKDFLSMLKTIEPNVGKEILKNRVILKGIENFYELVGYAERRKDKGSNEQFN